MKVNDSIIFLIRNYRLKGTIVKLKGTKTTIKIEECTIDVPYENLLLFEIDREKYFKFKKN